jgi:hypothetical protein
LRCQRKDCLLLAVGGTQHCKAHGGGKRCKHEGCAKAAATGGTQHCVAHGGGRRCQQEGCTKGAATGGTPHCQAHGGGKRCQKEGCTKHVANAPGSVLCASCLRPPRMDEGSRAMLLDVAARCAREWQPRIP